MTETIQKGQPGGLAEGTPMEIDSASGKRDGEKTVVIEIETTSNQTKAQDSTTESCQASTESSVQSGEDAKADAATEQGTSDNTGASEAKKPRMDIETSKTSDHTATSEPGPSCSADSKTDADNTMDTRKREERSRKRKLSDESEHVQNKGPPAVSTYDRVRLIIQPWRKPEGGVNKPIFKMMLESVMLYFMMKPGSGEESLVNRYKPYLQPMVLRYLVQILVDIGCLKPHFIKKAKVTLFSQFAMEETEDCFDSSYTDPLDEETTVTCYVPTEECLFRLGQFGKALFPDAKWPSTTVH